MQKKKEKSSILRKIFTIILLPVIIFIWMTGWTLTRVYNVGKPIEIRQKTIKTKNGFDAYSKQLELSNQDKDEKKVTDEPLVVA